MKSSEIRSLYLGFFEKKGHSVVPGIGLIPFDDPTLLFTSAGMVQFKKFWATDVPLPYKRATTCQKCLRAGGKDSDIDKIGITGRHHTFFEMLGNFSFGDYFKEEAIEWAWEFVVEYLKIPERNIWVSYYEKDDETKGIWKRFLPEAKIVPLSEEDNFWGPAGDTGPCGPCTELYIDFGIEKGCGGSDCKPGCECGRFLEFWNLVFPQYDKQKDGSLPPLKRRGVDTGMGLERITRIMQGTPSNYETDLFLPIIKEIEKMSGYSYNDKEKQPSFRITTDHIRAAVFLIDENILPSNEGRGYVLRRIIRRAEITGADLDIKEPFLHQLSGVVVDIMGDVYPTLKKNIEMIKRVIYEEEEKYYYLINSASKNFYIATEKVKEKRIPGDIAFKLYDTYGIPKDLLEDMSSQRGLSIDWDGFNRCLEEQREKARSSSEIGAKKELIAGTQPLTETEFCGYDKTDSTGKGIAVYKDEKKDIFYLVLDKTPFYPEKGGQIGDHGWIISEGEEFAAKFNVVDTQIDEKGIIYHAGKIIKGSPDDFIGRKLNALVSKDFRKRVSINHTATHLLHYALRSAIGKDVRQAGSFVGDTRLRFDFICFKQLSDKDIEEVENIVQEKIFDDSPVSVEETTLDEAMKKGAIALFQEKYGERVRVISIGDYHSEVCGGTHIKRTGEIILFKITNFSSIGQNLKRIEAVTYGEAIKYLNSYKRLVDDISMRFNTEPGKVLSVIEKLVEDREEKDRVIKRYEERLALEISSKLIEKKEQFEIDNKQAYLVSGLIDIGGSDFISGVADRIMKGIGEGVVFIGSPSDKGLSFVIKVSPDCSRYFSAKDLVRDVSGIIEGQGGGSNLFARGSGKSPEKFGEAVNRIKKILKIKV